MTEAAAELGAGPHRQAALIRGRDYRAARISHAIPCLHMDWILRLCRSAGELRHPGLVLFKTFSYIEKGKMTCLGSCNKNFHALLGEFSFIPSVATQAAV